MDGCVVWRRSLTFGLAALELAPRSAIRRDIESVGSCCQWIKSGYRWPSQHLACSCITYIRVVIDVHHSTLHALASPTLVVIDGHHSTLHALASPTLEW